MNLLKIEQYETTMLAATNAGIFDVDQWTRRDWAGRAASRPDAPVRFYVYQGVMLGWIEGEPADFETLREWVRDYTDQGKHRREALANDYAQAIAFLRETDGLHV